MPIIFITLSDTYVSKVKEHGYEAHQMKIQDYKPTNTRKTYYVSPANSLCFMDGGIDMALSRIIFPNIEGKVRKIVKDMNIRSIVGKPYLPIGSSMILDEDNNKSLVVAPTMLLPQNVATTRNAYYSTMAILYNILVNRNENLDNVDILMTSMCCGYGKMNEDESIKQILEAIKDYKIYKPKTILNPNEKTHIIINEPNLLDQPKYYQNTEWFDIHPSQIVQII